MTDLLRDLRQGFTLLLRAPGLAITAILTLPLGIGATTALFTVVNAVLLEPLPFPQSNRLIQVWRSELPALTMGQPDIPDPIVFASSAVGLAAIALGGVPHPRRACVARGAGGGAAQRMRDDWGQTPKIALTWG